MTLPTACRTDMPTKPRSYPMPFLKSLKSKSQRKAKHLKRKASAVVRAVLRMDDDRNYTAWDTKGKAMRTLTGKEWKDAILRSDNREGQEPGKA